MEKLINLIDQHFGEWTVIGRGKKAKNATYWLCQCSCGTIKDVNSNSLRNGKSLSCGCLQKKKVIETNKSRAVNYLGKNIGCLKIINKTQNKTKNGHIIWQAECRFCGRNDFYLSSENLNKYNYDFYCKKCFPNSSGEEKIKQLLKDNHINFIEQKTFEDCKRDQTKRKMFFDFYVEEKYLIEFDGDQHYFGWGHDKENIKIQQERDQFKNNWAKLHNIPLIRIPYYIYNDLQIEDLLLETSKYII